MEDIQNQKGNFEFNINKVGVENIEYPLRIGKKDGEIISTIGNFSMAVSLEKNLKGINMSRLPIILSQLYNDKFYIKNYKDDIKFVLDEICERLQSKDSYLDIDFKYFLTKTAPVSKFQGLMPYKCKIKSKFNKITDEFDLILYVEVPVTTLCPCSKAISEYSAHNQRGYVIVEIRYNEEVFIEDIISIVEASASCELYPILKRVDEKYVTEKAYENPRFVEDIVRLTAKELNENHKIIWFKVSSHNQESIHPHDAFATIEVTKIPKA
ncbi:GTP cyclohydrolase FolE2 [Clostridium akagii]|uniref:GTP cyclohydrolase FolE2 n=1 Tax=Clostridium akagii TaxID=91623 RepID=UPI000479F365|nr:GTP cyclohydrolase FolE2 [Clostridium akagii]